MIKSGKSVATALGCVAIWDIWQLLDARSFGPAILCLTASLRIFPVKCWWGVCAAVAFAGAIAHLALEPTIRPNTEQWGAILLLGIGPTGLAFLLWDYATKHGNLPVLGALSYLAPLLSTLLLVCTGAATASITLGLSAFFIFGGAVLASWQPRQAKKPSPFRA